MESTSNRMMAYSAGSDGDFQPGEERTRSSISFLHATPEAVIAKRSARPFFFRPGTP